MLDDVKYNFHHHVRHGHVPLVVLTCERVPNIVKCPLLSYTIEHDPITT